MPGDSPRPATENLAVLLPGGLRRAWARWLKEIGCPICPESSGKRLIVT